MFSSEFRQVFKNTFLIGQLQATAFAYKNLWNVEAVVQSCSAKKLFLEISQNSQENTCARVSFLIKLQALGRCFPDNFVKFLRTPFYWQNTSGGCFWKNKSDQKKKR